MKCKLKSSLGLLQARILSLNDRTKASHSAESTPPDQLNGTTEEGAKTVAESNTPVVKKCHYAKKPALKKGSTLQACATLVHTTMALRSVTQNVAEIHPDPKVLFNFQRLPSYHDIDNETFRNRRKIFLVYLCISVVIAIAAGCVSPILELMVLGYKSLLRGQIESTFYVMFAHCLLVLLLTALGFFAYFRNGYKTIVAYSVFCMTLCMLLVICIVYSVAMRHEFHEHLKPTMFRGLRNYAEVKGADTDLHWDNLQKKFQCCGLHAPSDWKQSGSLHQAVPDSCCKSPSEGCGKVEVLTGGTNGTGAVHSQGCYKIFDDWLNVYTYCLLGFVLFMTCWQIIGAICGWYLVRITKLISKDQRIESRKRCCV